MRQSRKREKILELFRKNHVLRACDILAALPEVDKTTVYRNLQLLTDLGTIKELHIEKDSVSYELKTIGDYHQHFICDECHAVQGFSINESTFLGSLPPGVNVSKVEVMVHGTCNSCKSKLQ